MIKCPKTFDDEERWITLALLAYIIKSDAQMMGLEINYFKDEISEAFGIDEGELAYFDEIMGRRFDPRDFDKIDAPDDKIAAKHILKEAMRLSLVDGDYSSNEKSIMTRWAEKCELGPSFVDDLETYVRMKVGGGAVDSDLTAKVDEMGEDLLNKPEPCEHTHRFFSEAQSSP